MPSNAEKPAGQRASRCAQNPLPPYPPSNAPFRRDAGPGNHIVAKHIRGHRSRGTLFPVQRPADNVAWAPLGITRILPPRGPRPVHKAAPAMTERTESPGPPGKGLNEWVGRELQRGAYPEDKPAVRGARAVIKQPPAPRRLRIRRGGLGSTRRQLTGFAPPPSTAAVRNLPPQPPHLALRPTRSDSPAAGRARPPCKRLAGDFRSACKGFPLAQSVAQYRRTLTQAASTPSVSTQPRSPAGGLVL